MLTSLNPGVSHGILASHSNFVARRVARSAATQSPLRSYTTQPMTTRRAQAKLTDVQLRNWIRAAEPIARTDGGGLTFTLSASGTATWVLRYRYAGKGRELTLGNYPDLALGPARKLAASHRVDIDAGGDPAGDKQAARRASHAERSVDWLLDDYRVKVLRHLSASTNRSYSRQLKRISLQFKGRGVGAVRSEDIVALVRRYEPNGWREAETLWIVAKEVFKHARGQSLISVSPCTAVDLVSVIGNRPPKKKRLMLSDAELVHVLNPAMNRTNQLTIWILLATMVRSEELITARRDNLHLDDETVQALGCARWHIPASKTGPATDIPLAPMIAEWFRELISLAWDSQYVLPARTHRRLEANGDIHINNNTAGESIQFWLENHKPPVRRFTPHDLRSTGRSHLRALGIGRDIAEMCLNHKLQGVEGIYDQYNYWPERRDALQRWAEKLEGLQQAGEAPAHSPKRVPRRLAR